MGKSVEHAMEFRDIKSSKPKTEAHRLRSVHEKTAVKEIERQIDNFGLGRILWYITRRYKFQISVLINVAFIATPIIKFVHQFFQ